MIQGAIFDVDGTLLDSMGMWFDVCRKFCTNHGVKLSDEQAYDVKELRLEQSLPVIIQENNLGITLNDAIAEIKELAAIEYRTAIPLKPHAKDYLSELKNSGTKIAVATSGYPELCTTAFKRLDVYNLIDVYAFSHEVGKSKDNPDVYLLAAERIDSDPSECTVFEDIVAGIQGAKKGGFSTCAVYDFTNESDTDILKKYADKYIKDWSELLS